jgi:uncharacterized protein
MNRSILHLPIGLLALFLTSILISGSVGPVAYPGDPYDVILYAEDLMMEARDGVGLATDIYRPARNGQPVDEAFPVLLQRTPYDKGSGRFVEVAQLFASHGYVVALQDTRGRYASEGVFVKYYDYDALDGYDAIEFLAALPYTEPRVGTWGTSYGAHTQADPAKLDPPSLATMIVNQGGMSDAWDHSVGYHGTYEVGRQHTWAFSQLVGEPEFLRLGHDGEAPLPGGELLEKGRQWLTALPFRKGLNPLAVAPNLEDYVLEMATLGVERDYEYFKGIGLNWVNYYEETADVPMIHVGGWYDIYARGTIDNYMGLARVQETPVHLMMGPWIHGGTAPERTFAGDVDFGSAAAVDDFSTHFHLRWFDHFLKGEENEVAGWAPVNLFVMGTGDGTLDPEGRLNHGGHWIEAEEWPLPDAEFVPYYFHPDGSLSPQEPPAHGGGTTYVHDPDDPVPTIGGPVSGRLIDGAFDQREDPRFFGSSEPYLPLRSRSDVVVFQTEPLETDMKVVGPIVVRLHASTSVTDTDFTAKLVDVYPPSADYPEGFDLNITDGVVRARYRDHPSVQTLGPGVEELVTPGEIYEFEIRAFPTANVFKAGHRIRVDIASSNFPRFDVNPGTGEPVGRNRLSQPAENTVHHDRAHPSHVILPIVPLEDR